MKIFGRDKKQKQNQEQEQPKESRKERKEREKKEKGLEAERKERYERLEQPWTVNAEYMGGHKLYPKREIPKCISRQIDSLLKT